MYEKVVKPKKTTLFAFVKQLLILSFLCSDSSIMKEKKLLKFSGNRSLSYMRSVPT